MTFSTRIRNWVLAACAVTLLFAQLLGLHYHRHIHADSNAAHASELHVSDAWVHEVASTGEGCCQSLHADHEAGAIGQAHLDVDSSAVKPVPAKPMLEDVALFAPLLLLTLLWCLRRPSVPLVPTARGDHAPGLPYRLRPPSQAPPLEAVLLRN